MIKTALTDQPQTSEQIRQRLIVAYGADAVPSATTLQSTLASSGERFGIKHKEGNKVTWVRFGAEHAVPPPEPAAGPSEPAPEGHAVGRGWRMLPE